MKCRDKNVKTPKLAACRRRFAAALFLMVFIALEAVAAPQVAASIKPLQLIAAAITDGVTEPHLVLGNNQDPHHASLRPSDRKALAEADIILWVGPMLELPLVEIISNIDTKDLAMQRMTGMIVHEVAGHPDPHVWLDTRNARNIADNLAEELKRLDIANADRYQTNLRDFHNALDGFDAANLPIFATLRSQPWTVYHNAFRYFATQFALTVPLAPTESANNQAGIRSIMALRDNIKQQNITCMLTEPDMNHNELKTLLGTADLHIVTADIMGYALEPAADAYVVLMRNFAATLAGCLQNRPE